jgi:hypothetical protein
MSPAHGIYNMSSPTMQDERRLPSNICGGIESTIENILFPQHQLEPIQIKIGPNLQLNLL